MSNNDVTRDDYADWCDMHQDKASAPIPVSEVFGPTLQGEGPYAGRACWFIRTGGCNLSCDFCDTPYSTGQHGIPLSTVPKLTARQITEKIPAGSLVVLTGGEPLMHLRRPAMQYLLHSLKAMGCRVHVETNGVTVPDATDAHLFDHFSVSPKLGVSMVNRNHSPSLGDWSPLVDRTIFKWVVTDTSSPAVVAEAVESMIEKSAAHGVPAGQVWVMPEGATTEELEPRWAMVAQAAADAGINATHRLHTLAWGDSKGH